MDIYLAGTFSRPYVARQEKIFILESFCYVQDWMKPYIKNHWDFLLDSGAFTYMNQKKAAKGVDWDDYVDRYSDYINENNIKKFFELDIDNVVGLKRVEQLRARLESRTGSQSIPVWHKSRGKDYFIGMCKDYGYIAIGGIVSGEIKKKDYPFLRWFIDKAHDLDTKIHGLGFTSMKNLLKYRFDSVDSTGWISGNFSGRVFKFNGKTIDAYPIPDGTRLKTRKVAVNNFNEWVKFQRYAKVHL